ncbi:MAG TPA: zinc-dependent metalloprotease [Thermoleophilaceae bacterium]|nr:zinc-dependent metalloprotease [Thermoleophilaceae bacterium]
MVEWSLARRIARLAAGADEPAELGVDLRAVCAEMELHVAACTGLELAAPAPSPELLGRGEWADMNLESFERLLEPVTERLEARLEFAGPLAGALRLGAGATIAAEAGLVMGYVSQRVLGQYELSLLSAEVAPRLVFVAPNLDRAVREMDVDRDSFFGWIAIHELTHVFQFQGVPWLRDHVGGLIREYMETVDVKIERGNAGALPSLPDLSELVDAFREGGLAALVQTGEQRELMGRINAAMAVIEGYSEHVMDALGRRLLPAYDGLREAMERRRRSRSAPQRIIERLLGFELKLRQYELGRGFCEAVVAREGMEALNPVWASPEALPSPSELKQPERWLERIRAKQLEPAL